jgi:hypothetical protein
VTDPYAQLAALAEQEWSAVTAQAWEQLPALAADRAELVATLPAIPPADAAAHLHRLAELQALVTAALSGACADGRTELARFTSRRGAVHGYATAGRAAA